MTTARWRIARVDRTQVRIVPDDPAALVRLDPTERPLAERCVPRHPDGTLPTTAGSILLPAVGDVVLLEAAQDPRSEPRALLAPRTGELVRDSADRSSGVQVVAANVDTVLIVEHLDPEPKLARIERFLTLTRPSGAHAVVLLTKADLAPDAADWVQDADALDPAVPVLAVSVVSGAGLVQLRTMLEPNSALVVVGPSGAGKSSLVNALAGAEVMPSGRRRSDGKGRHTTTASSSRCRWQRGPHG